MMNRERLLGRQTGKQTLKRLLLPLFFPPLQCVHLFAVPSTPRPTQILNAWSAEAVDDDDDDDDMVTMSTVLGGYVYRPGTKHNQGV